MKQLPATAAVMGEGVLVWQVLHLVAANPLGGEVAWKFITDNWPTLIYEQGWPCASPISQAPLLHSRS